MNYSLVRHLVYNELMIVSEPAAYTDAQNIIAENKLADATDPQSIRQALRRLLLLKILPSSSDAASFIHKRFGDAIFAVPGFYPGRKGTPLLNCGDASALLPYFNANGLIVGCVVFPVGREGFYLLSSSRYGGPAAVRPPRKLSNWLRS